jgi:hypothetical protein
MRRAIGAVVLGGTAVVVVASALLPWAWREAKEAFR